MNNNLIGMTLPTCEILVNGQKRKLYGKKKNKVYLHNGDNFQLKLFNPLQERIGVQLCMNGIKADNDLLILNPGQEITIERFIGINKKLTFSTYEIDTSNNGAVKAIEKNGILKVVFWNEKIPVQTVYTTTSTINNFITYPAINSTIYSGCSVAPGICVTEFDQFNTGIGQYYASSSLFNTNGTNTIQFSPKLETGRIENGSISNQYFSPINFEVNEEFYKIKFKLLPFSLKPVKKKLYDSTTIKNIVSGNSYVKNESTIRDYCRNCSYRISRGKGTWGFCPKCGKKIK